MISPLTFVTLSSLAVAALAGEVIPIFRHTDVDRSKAVKLDHSRWHEQASAPANKTVDPVTNTIFSYIIQVNLGTPGQEANVVVDTGSTALWVASQKCTPTLCGKPRDYFDSTKSKTFKKVKGPFQVHYGSGEVSGYWGRDIVSFTKKLSVSSNIGLATKAKGLLSSTTDGIMGLRPPQPASEGEVPTVVDELRKAGKISKSVLSVYFQPMTQAKHASTNGQMTLGSVDTANVVGPITYFPITKKMPAGQYWGFDFGGIYSGGKRVASTGAGILDTGTTLVLLSSKIGEAFFKTIPGAAIDSQTGLYSYPCAGLKNYPSFTIVISGRKFTLTAEEYTAPASIMEDLGVPKGSNTCESWISMGDTGLDIILGQKFLEFYVSIYDTDKRRMGLGVANHRAARNAHTNA